MIYSKTLGSPVVWSAIDLDPAILTTSNPWELEAMIQNGMFGLFVGSAILSFILWALFPS